MELNAEGFWGLSGVELNAGKIFGIPISTWTHHLYFLSSSSINSLLGLLYDLSHVMWTFQTVADHATGLQETLHRLLNLHQPFDWEN